MSLMPRFQPGELRWATGCGTVILACASLPYVVAWLLTPGGHGFTWVLSSAFDVFSYYAKIQQSASGAWLLTLPYTSDIHSAAFLYPQYVLLGKLGALTGLPNAALYHLLRIVGGAALLAAGYLFVATVASQLPVRRAALLFTGLGGGLSWFTSLFGVIGIDTTVPESNTFHILLVNPHFALATAALLMVINLALWSGFRLSGRGTAASSLLAAAAVAMQPFFVPLAAGIGVAWTLLTALRDGVRLPRVDVRLAVPVAAAVGTAGLMWLQLQGDPILARWTTQNQTPSPSLWHLLAGYGLLAPLALVGGIQAWRAPEGVGLNRQAALVALAWVMAVPVLFYLPTQFQRRLTEGSHIPMSLLAAVGLWWLAQRLGTGGLALAAVGGVGHAGHRHALDDCADGRRRAQPPDPVLPTSGRPCRAGVVPSERRARRDRAGLANHG